MCYFPSAFPPPPETCCSLASWITSHILPPPASLLMAYWKSATGSHLTHEHDFFLRHCGMPIAKRNQVSFFVKFQSISNKKLKTSSHFVGSGVLITASMKMSVFWVNATFNLVLRRFRGIGCLHGLLFNSTIPLFYIQLGSYWQWFI